MGDIFSVGHAFGTEEANEGLLFVSVGEARKNRFWVDAGSGGGMDGGKDATADGDEMGGEVDHDWGAESEGEFLFDLGEVTMFRGAISANAFIALDIKEFRLGVSSCATYSAQAIDDDSFGANEVIFQEWM